MEAETKTNGQIEEDEPPVKIRKAMSDIQSNSPSSLQLPADSGEVTLDPSNSGVINDVDNSSAPNNTLHPLMDIEHVLMKALSYLDLQSLKTANLVCTTWSKQAKKLMVKTKKFCFTDKMVEDFIGLDESLEPISIKNYILGHPVTLDLVLQKKAGRMINKSLNEEDDSISYEKAEYFLSYLSEADTIIAQLNIRFCASKIFMLARFLSAVSHLIRRLRINLGCSCTYPLELEVINLTEDLEVINETDNLSRFLKTVEGKPRSFLNLTSLMGNFTKVPANFTISKFLAYLLSNSPFLEDLICEMPPTSTSNLGIVPLIKSDPSILQNLKNLYFVTLNKEEMETLLSKNLKLETFSFRLYSGFRVPLMEELLSSMGKTLKTLMIDFGSLPRFPESFQCAKDLKNLTSLTIRKFYGSIHFVSQLTNLKSLTLLDINLTVALNDEAPKYNYKSKLHTLAIFGTMGTTGRYLFPTVYRHIVNFFPELRVLRLEYLSDSTLKIIVKGLPRLEELDIKKGVYTDRILTVGQKDRNWQRSNNSEDCSLADLRFLRKLNLQSPKITDLGILNGLVNFRELRTLSINTPMISDKSLQAIGEMPLLRNLEFVNCYQLSPIAIEKVDEVWKEQGRNLIATYT